jgi:transcriptional regulator with XRE-family HTH domain
MELGDRVAAWRRYRGWKQSELAARSGLSRAAICQIEGAGEYKSSPSQRSLNAIVDALDVTLTRFYGRIPKPRSKAA